MQNRDVIKLALKYLIRYRRRYRFLFLALAFGFAIASALAALKAGITENLYLSAQSHYAGDVVFLGYNSDASGAYARRLDAPAKKIIYDVIAESHIPIRRTAERTLFNDDATLFFNGESLMLRYLHGVDWQNEREYFESLSYIEGSIDALGDDSIVISGEAAKVLNVKCGDSVIIEAPDCFKQKNTQVFIVDAIIYDKTLFGLYKAYIHQKKLNELLSYNADDCSSIGVFVRDRSKSESYKVMLRNLLADKIQTAPVLETGEQYRAERSMEWQGIKVFVLTIPLYVADLYQLIDALNLLTYVLYAMLLLIIFVSAGVTYRLILHERMRELGTMRAIGFSERTVTLVLLMETIALGTVSIAVGCALAALLCAGAGLISLNMIPGFEILLSNGRLTARAAPLALLFNSAALYAMLICAVCVPSGRTVRAPLPEMLAGGAKG